MITIRSGDLFESQAQCWVNTVNCVSVMGKGIALEFKNRFPDMFEDYKQRCHNQLVEVGHPYLYNVIDDEAKLVKRIINFPTKEHWRDPSKYEWIADGLDFMVERIKRGDWFFTSIAFPVLGCGNGGLSWNRVRPIMLEKLADIEIPIEIYVPLTLI